MSESTTKGEPAETDDPTFRRDLGVRIQTARKLRGMKAETLARELGASPATVSRWENGHFAPGVLALKRVAQLLSVTIDHLCGCEPTPSIVPGAIIVDNAALAALRSAASQRASLSELRPWMRPPGIAIAHEVPPLFEVLPPDRVNDLRQEVDACLQRLR
jgi:transcriptional regulator with XRE-family HTH domain